MHSAVCSQISCISCLSNNDIQRPDEITVPCTTPYFHKDTLTPPSSSRSSPLEGGGLARMQPATNLYITHTIYFEIYTPPLEGIQLMSIAGYEVFVCVCFFAYNKKLCALHMASMGCAKKLLLIKLQKKTGKERKAFKNEQKVGMLLQKKHIIQEERRYK